MASLSIGALFVVSALCITAIALLLQAHAEYIEYTDEDYQRQFDALQDYPLPDFCIDRSPPCIVEIRNMTQSVHRVVDGEPVFEQYTIPAQYYRLPPDPELEGCTKTEGTIRWDSKFEDSKILPDLQEVIDSGAERLCITIMPNLDPKYIRFSSHLHDVRDGVRGLLSQDGVQIEWAPARIIWAAIPASLLDELVDSDFVANIDVYGKEEWIPLYALAGHDSKFYPSLQREIDTGMKPCLFPIIQKDNIISLLDEDDHPVPKEDYTIDYESRILEYLDHRIVVMELGPEQEPGLIYQYILTTCPLDKNDDGRAVFNLSLILSPVETWPDGSPDWTNITREERRQMIDKRDAEIAPIHAAMQQPVIDLLESNGQTVLKRGSITNFITADITEDFLPLLEDVDVIEAIETRNGYGMAACTDCGLTDQDEVHQNSTKAEQFPANKTDIILNDNSAIINATMTVVPNSIPVPNEILGKDITVIINNRTVTDYDIIEADDNLQMFLVLREDDTNEPAKLDDKMQPIPLPKTQIANGVQSKDLLCDMDRHYVMMNDRTVCITNETAQIFIDRGFDIVRLGQ